MAEGGKAKTGKELTIEFNEGSEYAEGHELFTIQDVSSLEKIPGRDGDADSDTIDFFPQPSEKSDDDDENGKKGAVTVEKEKSTISPTVSASSSKTDASESGPKPGFVTCLLNILLGIYAKYSFVIQVIGAIFVAKSYPDLGATYMYPEITAGWLAVMVIFVLAGFNLRTAEFVHALKQPKFNAFVQLYNFGFISASVFGVSRLLELINFLPSELADGMVICACLPMTINMVLVLTREGGGHEASAIFNAACSNMIGVFLSPTMIFGYLGVAANVDIGTVFLKISARVVIPLTVGQAVQKTSPAAIEFAKKHKPHLVSIQKGALVYIVYSVFCRTFMNESTTALGDIMLMVFFQSSSLMTLMATSWFLLGVFFRNDPKLRVMGAIGCTHKTVAMGIPLITTMYQGNPNIGLYTLPLLVWHPMQLILGSVFAPRLKVWVENEKAKLGINDEEDMEVISFSSEEESYDSDEDDEDSEEMDTDTERIKNRWDDSSRRGGRRLESIHSIRSRIQNSAQSGDQEPEAYEWAVMRKIVEGDEDNETSRGADPDGVKAVSDYRATPDNPKINFVPLSSDPSSFAQPGRMNSEGSIDLLEDVFEEYEVGLNDGLDESVDMDRSGKASGSLRALKPAQRGALLSPKRSPKPASARFQKLGGDSIRSINSARSMGGRSMSGRSMGGRSASGRSIGGLPSIDIESGRFEKLGDDSIRSINTQRTASQRLGNNSARSMMTPSASRSRMGRTSSSRLSKTPSGRRSKMGEMTSQSARSRRSKMGDKSSRSNRSRRSAFQQSPRTPSSRLQRLGESLRSITLVDPGDDFSESIFEL